MIWKEKGSPSPQIPSNQKGFLSFKDKRVYIPLGQVTDRTEKRSGLWLMFQDQFQLHLHFHCWNYYCQTGYYFLGSQCHILFLLPKKKKKNWKKEYMKIFTFKWMNNTRIGHLQMTYCLSWTAEQLPTVLLS